MAYTQLAEGGQMPVVITEGSGKEDRDGLGGGVMAILFVLLIIVIAVFAMIGRREPIADRDSNLASMLPAMMVAMTTRQNVDVNSHNQGVINQGPSNFDIYRQGVATNDNVFVQSCQTRETITSEARALSDKIDSNRIHELELQVAEERANNIALNTQLTSERQFNALVASQTAQYNSLQTQINQIPKAPVSAYCVSPFGPYHAGTVRTFSEACNQCS